MPNVTLQIDADAAKAIRELVRFAQAQGNAEKSTDSAARSTRRQKEEIDALEVGVNKVVSATMGMAAAALSIQGATQAWQEYKRVLDSINEKKEQVAPAAIALDMVLQPEGREEYRKRAQLEGARRGIGADATLMVYQRAVSVYGQEAAPEQAGPALDLGAITQDSENAKQAFASAREMDMTVKDFVSTLIGSANKSASDESVFMKNIRALPAFSLQGQVDPSAAFAAMVAESGRYPDELATYTENLARAIVTPNALTEQIGGYQDLKTFPERINAIDSFLQKNYGSNDYQAIDAAGLTEIRQANALATLFQNKALFDKVYKESKNYPTEFDSSTRLKELIDKDPLVKEFVQSNRNKAMADYDSMYGPMGKLATEQARKDQVTAAELGTANPFVNERGEVTWTGRIVRGAIGLGLSESRDYMGEGQTQREFKKTDDAFEAQNRRIDNLIKALDDNTDEQKRRNDSRTEVPNRNAQIGLD